MKRAVIAHCWSGYPEYCWYPWAKRQLEAEGFSVSVPEFPDRDTPQEKTWLPALRAAIGKPDDQLFLIGHSAGCITILRYLETLGKSEQVGGVVLVAGFTDDLGYKELSNFFETPIDFPLIRSKVKNGFVAIHSDDDPYVPVEYGEIFNQELGAEVVIKHSMGHFSGLIGQEGSCVELPDVIYAINRLIEE